MYRFILIPLLLSGCAANKQIIRLEQEIVQIRNRQAEFSAELEEQRLQLSKQNGKIEELEFSAKGQVQQMAQTIKGLSSRVPPPTGVPVDLLERDEEEISKYQTEAAAMYRDGLSFIRSAEFSSAIDSFKSFLAANPDTRFSDNALFWQGVAHEKLGEYDLAIISYNEAFSQFPAEDRADASLFKLAVVFEKLGTPDSKQDAIATLEKLVEDYPRSSFVTEAKKQIKKLKR